MDYKEKYIAALERASKLRVQNPFDTVGQMVEHIFPELKESEDEHKKWILEYLYDGLRRTDEQFKDEFKAAIAWFEKQCEKESDSRYKYLEDLLTADDIHQMSMNEAMVEEAKDKAIAALSKIGVCELLGFEKQGEQKPYGQRKECEDCQFNYAGECKGFCQMKKDEQKPADNVEPKFKVGDIVQYITDSTDRRKIEEIDTLCNMYHTDSSPIMFEIEDEWKVVVNAEDVEEESVDKVESKKLDPDKVVEWIDEHVPTKFEDMANYVQQFKKDFGL